MPTVWDSLSRLPGFDYLQRAFNILVRHVYDQHNFLGGLFNGLREPVMNPDSAGSPDHPAAGSQPQSPHTLAPTAEKHWTDHEANIALYQTLSVAHPGSRRPALPFEIILYILTQPSRWIKSQDFAYPRDASSPIKEQQSLGVLDTTTNDDDPAYRGGAPSRTRRQHRLGVPDITTNDDDHDDAQVLHPRERGEGGGEKEGGGGCDMSNETVLRSSGNEVEKRLVWTAPLTATEIRRIRRVVFEVEGHDQGWSSYPQHRGTFENTWSWFEAALRPSSTKEDGEGRWEGEGEGSQQSGDQQQQQDDRHWWIQRNRHACANFERYRIEMDETSELVQALREGDRIEVYGHVRFGGWQNHVRLAKIEVWSVDDLSDIQT